jgi:hypothetical protein
MPREWLRLGLRFIPYFLGFNTILSVTKLPVATLGVKRMYLDLRTPLWNLALR